MAAVEAASGTGEVTVPRSEAELIAALREFQTAGAAVASEGSGSKRHHGPALAADARRLSLRGLDQVTAYEPGDLVVTAQAGVRLAELQRQLGEHGQWLPIDPPYADATLGGILATASAGPRRLGYGTIKDYVLGLRTVSAAGLITKSGGQVVKNVTGFDLHRLHVGAFGTLGVLVEVSLRVVPRPARSVVLALACTSSADAHQALLGVTATRLRPVSLDVVSGPAAAALTRALPVLPAGAALALIGIEGSEPVIERHLRDLSPRGGSGPPRAILDGAAAQALWRGLRDLGDLFRDALVVRVGARPQQLSGLLADLALDRAGALATMIHAGTGVARVVLPADDLDASAALLHGLAARARVADAYLVAESAALDRPGRHRLPWGGVPLPLAETLRAAWDPARRLNPGRMAP